MQRAKRAIFATRSLYSSVVLLAPPTSNTLLERVSRGSSWRTLRQCDLVATQTWLGSHILGVEAARQFLGVDVDVDVDVV